MIWQSTIDLTDDERAQLNSFAMQHEGSSEEKVPNALQKFSFAIKKTNRLLDDYLPKKYNKYLVQSWSINIPKGNHIHYNPHNHGYAHLSFIFYTKSDGKNNLVIKDMNNLEFKLSLTTNDFVIVPPYLTHMIEIGIASSDRISFIGDILLTELEYKSSMFLPPVNIWQELE